MMRAKNTFYFLHSKLLRLSLVGLFCVNVISGDDGSGCSVPDEGGIQEGLLTYLQEHNMYGKQFTCDDPNSVTHKYWLSICADAASNKPEAAVVWLSTVQPDVKAIGMRNQTTLLGNPGHWAMIQYGAGDMDPKGKFCKNTSMSSSLMIVCEPGLSQSVFEFVYFDDKDCTFLFQLRTADICAPAPGMGTGSILFIIFIVALALYFLVGVLYLRFAKGAKGVDQIPNRGWWFGLGNKLSDGCNVVCRCDQYCNPDPLDRLDAQSSYSGAGGYSPIGESAPITRGPQHMDRDTPLLKP